MDRVPDAFKETGDRLPYALYGLPGFSEKARDGFPYAGEEVLCSVEHGFKVRPEPAKEYINNAANRVEDGSKDTLDAIMYAADDGHKSFPESRPIAGKQRGEGLEYAGDHIEYGSHYSRDGAKRALKDRRQQIAESVPDGLCDLHSSLDHIAEPAELEAQLVQDVRDLLTKALELLLDPVPDGGDFISEILVVLPEVDERGDEGAHSGHDDGDGADANGCDLLSEGSQEAFTLADLLHETADLLADLAAHHQHGADGRSDHADGHDQLFRPVIQGIEPFHELLDLSHHTADGGHDRIDHGNAKLLQR